MQVGGRTSVTTDKERRSQDMRWLNIACTVWPLRTRPWWNSVM